MKKNQQKKKQKTCHMFRVKCDLTTTDCFTTLSALKCALKNALAVVLKQGHDMLKCILV